MNFSYQKYVELRDSRGVSDYRVATESGVNQSTFSDWKSGRSKPKLEKLLKIARYFDVPIEYFLEA